MLAMSCRGAAPGPAAFPVDAIPQTSPYLPPPPASQTKCKACGHENIDRTPCKDVSVEIEGKKTLEEALRSYTAGKQSSGQWPS